MLDRPCTPSLPRPPQPPPSPPPSPPPPTMAECRNFFDDTSWSSCRSTPSAERIPTAEDERHGHCVELSLSLSLGASASKPKQQPIVRPLPAHPHLDKERSGIFASAADAAPALRGQNDVAMSDKTLFSIKDSAFSLPLPSRDQVWQTLQKNGAVFGQGFQQSDGPKPFHDAASPMCSRRSASIQVMKPAKDLSEVVAMPIRRSCSNGVPQQSLSRQVSSIESLLERSPEPPTSSSLHQQQEALELQRKKEMQAQRRQEARKRRKFLIEEKLQKKARQNSGLQRLGSKQCVSSDEKSSLVSAPSIEGDGMPEAHHKPVDEYKSAKQGDDKKVRKSRNIEKGAHIEEAVQETHPLYMKDGNANMLAQSTGDVEHASHGSMHMKGGKLDNPTIEYDSACHGSMHANRGKLSMPSSEHYLSSHGSLRKMMSGEFDRMSHGSMLMKGVNLITPTNDYDHASYGSLQKMMASGCVSAPATDVNVIVDVQAAKDVNKGEGLKSFPSSCSETESTETKEENSSGQNDSSELQSSSQKSATESNHGYGGAAITPSVLPSMATTSSSMAYPPFPVMPIPIPYPVPGAAPANMPMQVNFPCFMQCPTAAIGENGNANPTPSSSQPAGPFPRPVSLGSALYSMPTPDGSHSWYSTTLTGRIPQSSGALVLNSSTSKDRVGVCSEGKWRHGSEKSAFSPLWRTASDTNQVVSEPQPSVRPLNSQVSVSGPQLSPAKTASDKSTDVEQTEKFVNNRNLPIGRQQSGPIAGRLQPYNMGVMDQSVSCSETERPILGSKGLDARQEMPVESGALRMGNVEIKQEEGVKQDDGSSESQLASEHSGPEVSYVQSGVIAKQKSGSLPQLPWVTTTGTGPNGKTISGVMYIANGRQVRLVCSCHGKHMSPAEFVEHSGSTDLSNPERNIVVNSFPFLNQLASTSV